MNPHPLALCRYLTCNELCTCLSSRAFDAIAVLMVHWFTAVPQITYDIRLYLLVALVDLRFLFGFILLVHCLCPYLNIHTAKLISQKKKKLIIGHRLSFLVFLSPVFMPGGIRVSGLATGS